jgi:lysophospholipase L1-like esterase
VKEPFAESAGIPDGYNGERVDSHSPAMNAKPLTGLSSNVPLQATVCLFAVLLAGCGSPVENPPATATRTPAAAPSPTPTSSPTPTRTPTFTPTPSVPPKRPLTIVFYGDSLLKVGEVGRQGKSGYSFVDNLRESLADGYDLILANYGGRMAKWAYEHMEEKVLSSDPDLVTIWWGFNDLLGCPGFFDRTTNALIPEKLDYLVGQHIEYLGKQLEELADKEIPAVLLTAIPVSSWLPWSHIDESGKLVWESGYWCEYNLGLKRLADEQRALAEEFAAAGKPVFLLDTWNLYGENWYTDYMYSDVMHPGPTGAALIAEEWLRVFGETGL